MYRGGGDRPASQGAGHFFRLPPLGPLAPQSHAMAKALEAKQVPVDPLFFPDTYAPALPHAYQFNRDTPAGQQALEQSVRFLSRRK